VHDFTLGVKAQPICRPHGDAGLEIIHQFVLVIVLVIEQQRAGMIEQQSEVFTHAFGFAMQQHAADRR